MVHPTGKCRTMAIGDVRNPDLAEAPHDVVASRPGSRVGRWAATVWTEHRALVVLLAIAVVVRALLWFAYRPALVYPDSWTYIDEALGSFPVGLGEIRPSGYALVLRVLQTPFHALGVVTIVQHLAGLATGVITYSLLRRLGATKVVTLVATGVVLLDAYVITLEQFILAEAVFTLTIMASIWLLVVLGDDDRAVAASGALLAFAVLQRGVGLI